MIMGEPIRGSLGVASSFQLTEQMEALDKQSKNLLQYREVLAVILKHTLEEYADYTVAEVMDCPSAYKYGSPEGVPAGLPHREAWHLLSGPQAQLPVGSADGADQLRAA